MSSASCTSSFNATASISATPSSGIGAWKPSFVPTDAGYAAAAADINALSAQLSAVAVELSSTKQSSRTSMLRPASLPAQVS